jgi:chromosome segregation ATPase
VTQKRNGSSTLMVAIFLLLVSGAALLVSTVLFNRARAQAATPKPIAKRVKAEVGVTHGDVAEMAAELVQLKASEKELKKELAEAKQGRQVLEASLKIARDAGDKPLKELKRMMDERDLAVSKMNEIEQGVAGVSERLLAQTAKAKKAVRANAPLRNQIRVLEEQKTGLNAQITELKKKVDSVELKGQGDALRLKIERADAERLRERLNIEKRKTTKLQTRVRVLAEKLADLKKAAPQPAPAK